MGVSARKLVAAVAMALVVGLTALVAPASAGGTKDDGRSGPVRGLRGLDYSMQNYFSAGPDLIPFFDQLDGTVGPGVEIPQEDLYIYSFNFRNRSITMRWNRDESFDNFEPYVGKAGGFTQEEAAAAGIADQYHITFDQPVSHLRPIVSPWAKLQPEVSFLDDHTMVISVPGGTTIGDGYDTRIWLLPRYRR